VAFGTLAKAGGGVGMTNTNAGSTPQAEHKVRLEKLDKLLGAANDGAKSLKALFFWYVGSLTYAVISVAGVSDEQLLRVTPLKLPIINVEIPLVEYFAVLPLVVVLIHLELLVQFALLSNKVNDFRSALPELPKEDVSGFQLRLENFMLSHLLAGSHQAILHSLLFLLVYGSLVVLPLFTLLMIQGQFLAYHSEPMMWWHRILVLLDTSALLYFWPNLFHREDMKAGSWAKLLVFRVLPRVLAFLLLLGMLYALLAWRYWVLADITAALGAVCVLAIIVSLRLPRQGIILYAIDALQRRFARVVLLPGLLVAALMASYWLDRDPPDMTLLLLGAAVAAFLIARLLESIMGTWRGFSTRAVKCYDSAAPFDVPGMTVFGAQCVLALAVSGLLLTLPADGERRVDLRGVCSGFNIARTGVPYWLLTPAVARPDYAARNEGADKPAGVSSDWCEDNWRETLTGDMADGRASIPAILLKGVGKRRVLVIEEKTLASHDLTPEQREKLRAGDAAVRAAIQPVDLRGRDLTGIQANDAALPRIKLDYDTRVAKASMDRAQLQGADFQDAHLQGAHLADANLEDAILSDTELMGAIMNRVRLNRAAMDETDLEGAVLDEARIGEVRAPYVYMNGAWLQDASLARSNAENASLSGAYLVRTDLRGASLKSAVLKGAWLADVLLQGADLTNADLDFAIVVDPQAVRPLSRGHSLFPIDGETDSSQGALTRQAGSLTRTTWPMKAASCLLILNAPNQKNQPLPDCKYVVGTALPDPSKRVAPGPELWSAFWQMQMNKVCAFAGDFGAERRRSELFEALSQIEGLERAEKEEMIAGLVEALVSEQCRPRFPRATIENGGRERRLVIDENQESGVGMIAEQLDDLLYYEWLQALNRIEPPVTQ
jgi:hypothetical protein